MDRLKTKYDGIGLYQAGLPDFPRNFTRDSIISAIIMRDSLMLKNQLLFSAKKQGTKKDSFTGEEPGKIFHEYPGVILNRLNTEYNACDTTALFLIAHSAYQKLNNDKSLAENQKENIIHAVDYILSHLNKNYLFYEDPKFCGANKFALKVTYWKDSEILGRKNGQPEYPVVYTLAHIQNLAAIRVSSKLLHSKKLFKISQKMKMAIQRLYDKDLKLFYIAIDKKGPIKGINSDLLHALFYLENGDIENNQIEGIERSSIELETSIGFRTLSPRFKMKDTYHSQTVWPFEQAIIHIGAKKFGLEKIQKISSSIIKFLDTEPEYFTTKNNKPKKAGCDPQLWTIAAKKYFNLQK